MHFKGRTLLDERAAAASSRFSKKGERRRILFEGMVGWCIRSHSMEGKVLVTEREETIRVIFGEQTIHPERRILFSRTFTLHACALRSSFKKMAATLIY